MLKQSEIKISQISSTQLRDSLKEVELLSIPVSDYIKTCLNIPDKEITTKQLKETLTISEDFHMTYLMLHNMIQIPIDDFKLISSKTYTAEQFKGL